MKLGTKSGRWNIGHRTLLIGGASLVLLAAVYWALIPSLMARQYVSGLNEELQSTKSALNKVAGAVSLPMFVDPDTSLADRQKQIGAAMADLQLAYQALESLERMPRLSTLPGGASLGGRYRTAQVVQSRMQAIRLQTGQTLQQYANLLHYLQAYTGLQSRLNSQLAEVNRINDFNLLAGRGERFLTAAQNIRADGKTLDRLSPPPDFTGLQAEAAATFRQAATGFEQLELGLELFSDYRIYRAVAGLEAVTQKSQLTDNDLLVALAAKSPTLRQLAELPEKIENAQARSAGK